MIDVLFILIPLVFLIIMAYRGASVIIFAPIAAMVGVLIYDPAWIPGFFTGIFMDKLSGFVKLYLPVFLLGAVFGKFIEIAGYAKSIARTVTIQLGSHNAILSIVLICAILTYGGVSLFVVVFAVYPFASELFRASEIPKRLIPGTIALGAFTFTMDAFPGTPQIQNIIPTFFFGTDSWAAPILGVIGGLLILGAGLYYLSIQKRKAFLRGEKYGTGHRNEPESQNTEVLPSVYLAMLPLVAVAVGNKLFGMFFNKFYGETFDFAVAGIETMENLEIKQMSGIWAVSGGLILGILVILVFSFKSVKNNLFGGLNLAVGGALLATINTASEYGFGGVIASLPGFKIVSEMLGSAIRDPLLNEAVTTTSLAGITGSASGGLSIALATMSDQYMEMAAQANISPEVLHRIASMASGGMDTLPHNGAVITLLAVTGLTHRESYRDIFFLTVIKVLAVFVVIGIYYATGWH